MLRAEIEKLLQSNFFRSEGVKEKFLERLAEGALTIQENPNSHFNTFFLPFNEKNKKVLIGDHKRSGLWLFPGGHIDEGETLIQTLNREIDEELGVKAFFSEYPLPFLFTISDGIKSKGRECKTHFDIWHLMETDGSEFVIDPKEYYETRWVNLNEASKLINGRPAHLQVIDFLSKFS